MATKTIREMNEKAAYTIAFAFLRSSESILAGKYGNPQPLSKWDSIHAASWLQDSHYTGNSAWAVTDSRWEKDIRPLAMLVAKQVLTYRPEDYPLTLKHFTKQTQAN